MGSAEVIQVRTNAEIKALSEKRARELGFLSVQEVIRTFLSQFAQGAVVPTVAPPVGENVILTGEAKSRYQAIREDITRGKNLVMFESSDDAVDWLNTEE